MLQEYLTGIYKTAQKGDATEPSYYPTLKELFENFAKSSGHTKVHVTALPKKTEAGNPDFRVWDGKQHVVGHIEAKHAASHNGIVPTNVCRLDAFRKKLDSPLERQENHSCRSVFQKPAMLTNTLTSGGIIARIWL